MRPLSTCNRRSRWRWRACPIDLPAPPAYRKVNPADTPVIFLALTSDTAQSQEINEFADKVMSPKLSTLPGVAQINIQGAQKRAVRIKYDLDALATRGISVEEVRLAVIALSSVGPDRQHPHRAAVLHPRDQGRRAYAPPISSRRWWPGATARRCGWRISPRSKTRSRTMRRGRSSTACARSSSPFSVNLMPTRSPSPTRCTRCCRRFDRLLPPTIKLSVLSDRSSPSATRCTTCS